MYPETFEVEHLFKKLVLILLAFALPLIGGCAWESTIDDTPGEKRISFRVTFNGTISSGVKYYLAMNFTSSSRTLVAPEPVLMGDDRGVNWEYYFLYDGSPSNVAGSLFQGDGGDDDPDDDLPNDRIYLQPVEMTFNANDEFYDAVVQSVQVDGESRTQNSLVVTFRLKDLLDKVGYSDSRKIKFNILTTSNYVDSRYDEEEDPEVIVFDWLDDDGFEINFPTIDFAARMNEDYIAVNEDEFDLEDSNDPDSYPFGITDSQDLVSWEVLIEEF